MNVVSVSRRTDIPAFYTEWFMNRLRAGYAFVPNPFNPHQVSTVPLTADKVACFVFVTKDPRPIFLRLEELERGGYRYYFHVTLTGLPAWLEPGVPEAGHIVSAIKDAAGKIGSKRIVWRFDPIVFSDLTPPGAILDTFDKLSAGLEGSVSKVIISFVRNYRQVKSRVYRSEKQNPARAGIRFLNSEGVEAMGEEFVAPLVKMAVSRGMEVVSCATGADLLRFGVKSGSCIDGNLINELFGIRLSSRKDPGQRPECGCIRSLDIGMYGTCRHRCLYCYACIDSELSRGRRHDPTSPFLLDQCQRPIEEQPSLF